MKKTLLIADIKLPEKSEVNIRTILEANNLPARLPEVYVGKFNCWGFTAFYYKWCGRAYWMDRDQMDWRLERNTMPIEPIEVQAGDVAVFRGSGYLRHTAVVLPGKMVCHKPGELDLCIDKLEAAIETYGEVDYVRPI